MKRTQHAIPGNFCLILATTLVLVLAACAPAPTTPLSTRDYWPTVGWRSDAPAKHGFDETKLAGLKPKIEKDLPFLNSLLIIKNGYLVYEEYFTTMTLRA